MFTVDLKLHPLLLRIYVSGFSHSIAGHRDFCRDTETAGYLMIFFLHWLMYQYDKITKQKKPETAPLYALISQYKLGTFSFFLSGVFVDKSSHSDRHRPSRSSTSTSSGTKKDGEAGKEGDKKPDDKDKKPSSERSKVCFSGVLFVTSRWGMLTLELSCHLFELPYDAHMLLKLLDSSGEPALHYSVNSSDWLKPGDNEKKTKLAYMPYCVVRNYL